MSAIIVGIDPGVHTGFAVWDVDSRRLQEVATMPIVQAMIRVQSFAFEPEHALQMVVFEDARLRTWFGAKGREALQGAGSIKRDCQVWVEWFERLGCAYRAVSPKAKGPKLDAARFAKLTGWEGRTSEHARDAAMLVFGMRPLKATA